MGYASPFLCLPARACATDCMLPRPRARSLRLCLVRKWWCRGLPTATTHRNISWTARRVRAQTSRSCWHPRGSTLRTTAFSSCRCATGSSTARRSTSKHARLFAGRGGADRHDETERADRTRHGVPGVFGGCDWFQPLCGENCRERHRGGATERRPGTEAQPGEGCGERSGAIRGARPRHWR